MKKEKTFSKTVKDFIDDDYLQKLVDQTKSDKQAVRDIIAKSLNKQALSVEDTAVLLAADSEMTQEIFEAARKLKREVYGNRIVLFAPFYIGNKCINNCGYCAFRSSNKEQIRRTLNSEEIVKQVEALENVGHKRLILVFGEHQDYDADFMAECVRKVYSTKVGKGEIRRVNINAAPLDIEGYKKMKAAGIGTYQIFMETYHHPTYAKYHPAGTEKGDYLYRLDGLSRAFEGGCDDVGVGALFGLYDWRFEALGLVSHALFLQKSYGVGPHTISFPRIQPAAGVNVDKKWIVKDEDFKKLVAILRLAVPYTGLILTARENPALRREMMGFGVSQIDAGSRIEIGGYTDCGSEQVKEREQFVLGDIRSLDSVMKELIDDGFVPSFCTACYRLGRTGEHFMEFAIPGFIKRFCQPNALSTLMEYLVDYASKETREAGLKLIEAELSKVQDERIKEEIKKRLEIIKNSEQRDLYF
ncbi:MAG: [FeFe] hydrogenase H-cluster radical SAM maturase HydG [Planctomycetaceae bacterium]|nr:[FeFe] hydrogenase H-cluster radical SAM maturase HydG [Planctomycetaceae bacterium]